MKVGDIVRLKDLDFCKNNSFHVGWDSPQMDKFAGKILKVDFICGDGTIFNMNGMTWNFCEEWIQETLNKEEK